jgi:hypothetical protein
MPNAVDTLLESVYTQIAAGDPESALSSIRLFLAPWVNSPRLYARVFGSRDLDTACIEIGKSVLAKRSSVTKEPHSEKLIFIASQLYMSGGHTGLLEDYIRSLAPRECHILVTDHDGWTEREKITERFKPLSCEVTFAPKSSNNLEKLEWLMDRLSSLRPEWCFFFNHPDDPVAVAAMQPELCNKIAFVHHTDHTFTLGLYAPSDRHLDFRPSGQVNCRHQLGVKNTFVVPLTVPDPGVQRTGVGNSGGLVTCTSGNNKFEHPYAYHFTEVLPRVLSITRGTHLHIGGISERSEGKIRSALREKGIPDSAFKVIPWVKSLWDAVVQNKVDLYIDSFPVTGLRALVEVMGAGVPILAHRNYVHNMLSSCGFVYEEAPVWGVPEDIDAFLSSFSKSGQAGCLRSQAALSRDKYLKNHTQEVFRQALQEAIGENSSAGEQQSERIYETDELRSFMDSLIGFLDDQSNTELAKVSRVLAALENMQVESTTSDQLLSNFLTPSEMEKFQAGSTRLANLITLNDALDSVYPVVENGTLNKERLSRMLFQLATMDDSRESTKNLSSRCRLLIKKVRVLLKMQ